MGLLEANTKVDSVDMVGFELLREGYEWMHNPETDCILSLAEFSAAQRGVS